MDNSKKNSRGGTRIGAGRPKGDSFFFSPLIPSTSRLTFSDRSIEATDSALVGTPTAVLPFQSVTIWMRTGHCPCSSLLGPVSGDQVISPNSMKRLACA